MIDVIKHIHNSKLTDCIIPVVLLDNFNINVTNTTDCRTKGRHKMFCDRKREYTQLLNQYTPDYHTQIDRIYTSVPQLALSAGSLESYYSDHKHVFVFPQSCLNIRKKILFVFTSCPRGPLTCLTQGRLWLFWRKLGYVSPIGR